MNIRKIALGLLSEYEVGGKYVNLSLASHTADKLTAEERAALTALLYTTVEHKLTYDYYISALSARAADDIDSYTRNILRLGLCQIIDMQNIPDFAAVNESVKLARGPGERAFVNGVLRAAVRSKDKLPMPSEEKNFKRYLSVKYSFPLWIVRLLDSLYGREDCERLLSHFNCEKYTDLTVNTLKIEPEVVVEKLRNAGYEPKVFDKFPSIRLSHSVNPERLTGFADGELMVQDRASLISVLALSPKPDDILIDVCACPGGKSFAAAMLMGDRGKIYSFDLHQSKLSLITDGADRLGISSIIAKVRDAVIGDEALLGTADKVICDVPCSGLGVMGKKPDLRYKSEESVKGLPELQLKILTASSEYLKEGGELLYSTCTLNPAENEEVVEAFLRENHEFCPVDFSVGSYSSINGSLTLLPHIHGTDGFFMAKIRRKSQR